MDGAPSPILGRGAGAGTAESDSDDDGRPGVDRTAGRRHDAHWRRNDVEGTRLLPRSDSDDCRLDPPGSKQCFHIRLITGQHLVLGLYQQRDVSVHDVVGPAAPEKLSDLSRRHFLNNSDVHSWQEPGEVGLSASVTPDLCDDGCAGDHRNTIALKNSQHRTNGAVAFVDRH